MILLEPLDPTSPDDPAFDPRGAQGRRVLRAALARHPAPPPHATRGTWRMALVTLAACAAAAVATGVVTTSAPDALAALQRAARAAAAAGSGQLVYTERVRTAGFRSDARWNVRFDGDALEGVVREEVVSGGSSRSISESFVVVGGAGYVRDDSKSSAQFERLEGEASRVDLPHRLVEHAGNTRLIELVRAADDLTVAEADDGSTVYRASASSGAVFDAAPTAAGRLSTPASEARVALEVTVGGDGRLRRVVIDRGSGTQTFEYRRLGEDQDIREP